MAEDKYRKAQEKIAEIIRKCKGSDHIFRGEDNADNSKIASTFYRNHKRIAQEGDQFSIDVEKDITLKEAKEHFPTNTSNIDILTEIQHHGGNTSLLDFTRNLHIALFFACDGRNRKKPGRVILLPTEKVTKKENITYEEDGYILLSPHSKIPRVIFQSGVFVHTKNGYIQKEDVTIEKIEPEIKNEILEYLREHFDIHARTIYNDIHGFIHNQKIVADESIKGLSKLNEGKMRESITHFDTIITANPQYALAYLWCGRARYELGEYQEAIKNFDKSTKIRSENLEVYYWCGMAKLAINDHEGVVSNHNKLIKADSQNNIYALALQSATQEKNGLLNEALHTQEKILEWATQNNRENMRNRTKKKIKKLRKKLRKKKATK